MAAGQLNRTRRRLLGAAIALPFAAARSAAPGLAEAAPATPAPPEPSSAAALWDQARAAFAAAEAEVRAIERLCAGRPYEEQAALDRAYDEKGDVMYDALRALLRLPAPDLHALADKLDLVVAHEVGTLTGGEDCLAALQSDARRLAGGG